MKTSAEDGARSMQEGRILPENYEPQKEEVELVRTMADFPETVLTALRTHSPAHVCNYIYSLARAFTAFYDKCPVLSAEEPVRSFRRAVVFAYDAVLTACTRRILGIELPDEM
jgi:arginyl-tRNA synthetase